MPVSAAFARMASLGLGRLPVVDDGDPTRLVGMFRRESIVFADHHALGTTTGRHPYRDHLEVRIQPGAMFFEASIARGSTTVGTLVKDIEWPHGAILGSVRRGSRVLIPHGDTVLDAGDTLTAFGTGEAREEVAFLLEPTTEPAEDCQGPTRRGALWQRWSADEPANLRNDGQTSPSGPRFRGSSCPAHYRCTHPASCSDSRPTVKEWQPTWETVVDAIPSESVIGESPPRAVCNETLGFLRSNRGSLFPTPDLAIDDAVGDWISIAEDAFFECPPNNEHVRGFSEMYQLLHRLQGEVELVLDMDRAP